MAIDIFKLIRKLIISMVNTNINTSKPVFYITLRNIGILPRPYLAKIAFKGIKTFYLKDIIKSFKLWRLISLLDKIPYSLFKYHLWKIIGIIMYLFSIKMKNSNNIIILNPIGVSEIKMLNKKSNVKVIMDYMDVIINDKGKLIKYHEEAVRSADGIIFWSKILMQYIVSKYNIKNYTYIPYGVCLKLFNPREFNSMWFRNLYGLKSKFIVTYSGGVWREKTSGLDFHGIDKLPQIFAKLHRKLGKRVIFVVNCPYDHILFKKFRKYNILNKIIWIKPIKFNAPLRVGLFSSSDVLILTSSRYPPVFYAERMKTFEYMASGKAIIAEKTPGICNILRHNYNAYLTELGNVNEIVDGIIKLYDNKNLRFSLGEKAYIDIKKKYNWNILSIYYRNFIKKIFNR